MNGTSQRESYSSRKVAAASPTRTESPLSSINRHQGFGEPSLPPIRTCTLPSRPTPDVPAQYQIRNKPFLRSRSESCHSTAANDLHASASFSARKNPQRIPANTPPVISRLRPRIYQQLRCLVTKDDSDRLLAASFFPNDHCRRLCQVVLKDLASFLIFVENNQNASILTGLRTGPYSLLRLYK